MSIAYLDGDAELLHLLNRLLAHVLTEAQVERAQQVALVREQQQRCVGNEMSAASQIEREQ